MFRIPKRQHSYFGTMTTVWSTMMSNEALMCQQKQVNIIWFTLNHKVLFKKEKHWLGQHWIKCNDCKEEKNCQKAELLVLFPETGWNRIWEKLVFVNGCNEHDCIKTVSNGKTFLWNSIINDSQNQTSWTERRALNFSSDLFFIPFTWPLSKE